MNKVKLSKKQWKAIKESANLAPSIFNTKPWHLKFDRIKSSITIESTPRVTQNDYMSIGHYISIGACAENVKKCTIAMGFTIDTRIDIEKNNSVEIKLIKSSSEKLELDMHNLYLKTRKTSRKNYQTVDLEKVKSIVRSVLRSSKCLDVKVIHNKEDIDNLKDIHTQSMNRTNLKKNREIASFMNLKRKDTGFNRQELGINYVVIILLKTLFSISGKPFKPKIKGEGELILHTPAVLVFSSKNYNSSTLVACGMEIETIWLEMCKAGLSCQPLFSIIAHPDGHKDLKSHFDIDKPVFIMRVGKVSTL